MQPETVQPAPQPAPKQPLSSRLAEIDILKGVALLGILLVNFAGFNSSLFSAMPGGGLVTTSGGRDVAALVVNWLVQGKFILIFAFLVGWSTYVQARQEGGFRGRWLRRLLGLLLLGVAHGIFLFSGDILATYALLGLFMLRPVVREWPVRRVVRSAVILGAVSIAILAALSALLVAFPSGPDDAPLFSDAARIYASGTFLEVSRQRALEFAVQVLVVVLLFGPMLLAAMRLGFAAAMTYAGVGVEAARPLARRLLPSLGSIGLLGNAAGAWASTRSDAWGSVGSMAQAIVFAPMLSLAYISAAVLLLTPSTTARLGSTLGAAGRISLSVYLGQSVLMSLIFCGYGFGLFGKVSNAAGILLCLAVWAVLVVASALWLRSFRVGPAEALLRSITEWRWLGRRRPVAVPTA